MLVGIPFQVSVMTNLNVCLPLFDLTRDTRKLRFETLTEDLTLCECIPDTFIRYGTFRNTSRILVSRLDFVRFCGL